MLTRRAASLLAAAAALPGAAHAAESGGIFYDAVGPALSWWRTDVEAASLSKQGSVTLPALVQYAWRSPIRPVLYHV